MLRFVCLLSLLAISAAGPQDQMMYSYEPKPYSFGYESLGEDGGRHSHSQTSDGVKVTGQYELVDTDGRNRIVEYVADEMGFRANIKTNEPGTENASPADVNMEASPTHMDEPMKYAKPMPMAMRVAQEPRPMTYSMAMPRRMVDASALHYAANPMMMMPMGMSGSRYVMASPQMTYRLK